MLYSNGKIADPGAGEILAGLWNPTTALDVKITNVVLTSTADAEVLVCRERKGGVVISAVSFPVAAGRTVALAEMSFHLDEGEGIVVRLAGAVNGVVQASFVNQQFRYPCAKAYGEEKIVKVPAAYVPDPTEDDPERTKLFSYAHEYAQRKHCGKLVGHEHIGDPDCGPAGNGA